MPDSGKFPQPKSLCSNFGGFCLFVLGSGLVCACLVFVCVVTSAWKIRMSDRECALRPDARLMLFVLLCHRNCTAFLEITAIFAALPI